MKREYHKPASIVDYVVGKSRDGVVHAKRYTVTPQGYHSDYPLWDIELATLGM